MLRKNKNKYKNSHFKGDINKWCRLTDYVLGLTKAKNYSDSKKGMFISTMAKHINEICLEQHFTNLTLAEKLNTCESNIRNYRNGKYFILTALALDLALKFNYSVDWIIGKTNKKTLD